MIVCLCFVDALLYGRSISTDQNLAYWSFQNQNEWPRAIIVSSETLSRLDGTWTLIENNTLISIDVKTRKLEIEMV